MEDAHAVPLAVAVDAAEPVAHARIERDAPPRLLEGLAAQREPLGLRLLNHAGHVGEHHVGILLLGQRVGLRPELLVALAHGRNEVILLHVAGRERAVEIVNQGNGDAFLFHGCMCFGCGRRVAPSGLLRFSLRAFPVPARAFPVLRLGSSGVLCGSFRLSARASGPRQGARTMSKYTEKIATFV